MPVTTKVDEHSLKKRMTFTFSRIIISTFILALIIVLVVYQTSTLIYNTQDMGTYGDFVKASVNLAESAAAERGLSSILIGGGNSRVRLDVQRELTDEYVEVLKELLLNEASSFSEGIYNEFVGELDSLSAHRDEVDALTVAGGDNLDFYADFIANQLNRIISVHSVYGDITSLGYSFFHYALLQEYTGLRRGTLGLISAQGYFDPDLRYRISGYYASEELTRNALKSSFYNASNAFDEYYSKQSVIDALSITETATRYIFQSSNYSFNYDPLPLFNNMTVLIEELSIDDMLLLELSRNSTNQTIRSATVFTAYIVTMVLELISIIWFLYITYPVMEAYGHIHNWCCCSGGFKSKSISRQRGHSRKSMQSSD
eukprot:TRINITY_DN1001_c0_g1_i2.p1 TRINITY_DN1001_c0_g1~~TRINITY_DN1001_c0_g1_i2.p1  ORF type:complete len:372 (-),score=62.73 TRINITY_DN1001_c0_g1_i2:28-1143(-)